MTLGEKIKEARLALGFTQEELAEKLMVSRQAITKWESDKGIPDIENLKYLSKVLNVSIDYLVNDENVEEKIVIKEVIDFSKYPKGSKKKMKDQVMKEKFSNANICALMGIQELNKKEKVLDNIMGFLTPLPFGLPDIIKSTNNIDKEFYLVEKEGKQLFVMFTNEYMETREMVKKVTNKKNEKYHIHDFTFINLGPIK